MSYTFTKVEEYLSDGFEFSRRDAFVRLIEDLVPLIEQGFLKQISGEYSILSLQKSGAIPDVVICEFETIPGKTRYVLGYDYYHAANGTWNKFPVSST